MGYPLTNTTLHQQIQYQAISTFTLPKAKHSAGASVAAVGSLFHSLTFEGLRQMRSPFLTSPILYRNEFSTPSSSSSWPFTQCYWSFYVRVTTANSRHSIVFTCERLSFSHTVMGELDRICDLPNEICQFCRLLYVLLRHLSLHLALQFV